MTATRLGHWSEDGARLLPAIGRAAIADAFGIALPIDESIPGLEEPRATFVTLTRRGELRGCIGTLEASRSLRVDVWENALGAAFRDPRFPALRRIELDEIAVEVSVLSPPEPLPAADEDELVLRLRPFVDGVVVRYGWRRATFLPQVWDKIPDPRQFLAELRSKAGLPLDFWSPELRVERYTVDKYVEGRGREVALDE